MGNESVNEQPQEQKREESSVEDIFEATNKMRESLTKYVDLLSGIVGFENALLPHEYLRIARLELRQAVVHIANGVDSLNLIALAVDREKATQPKDKE